MQAMSELNSSGAIRRHESKVATVWQTITTMSGSLQVITSLSDTTSSLLVMVASTTLPQSDGQPQRFKLELPRLHIPDFAGPGDCFRALVVPPLCHTPHMRLLTTPDSELTANHRNL